MNFSLFIESNEFFDINFVVAKSKTGRNIYASAKEDDLKLFEDADLDTIQRHSVKFRYPDFADTVTMVDSSISIIRNVPEIHLNRYKMERIIKLIKEWTLGVPTDRENIEKLNPVIAAVIGNEMDSILS